MPQLKTSAQRSLNIDKDKRIIKNAVACQTGDIKDWRPWSINDDFLSELTTFANKQKEGILCNYGHNYDNLGKRLGRAHNFNHTGGKSIFELHIFETADSTPGMEGMGTYVMNMAEEDDKAIMFSIKFQEEYFYQVDSGGQHVKCWYYDEELGWVKPNPDLGKIYPKLKEFKAVDVVDEGAATDSFFSESDLEIAFNELISLEQFPAYLESNWKNIRVLNDFYSDKFKKGTIEKIKSLLGISDDADKVEDLTSQVTELQNNLHDKVDELTSLTAERDELQEQVTDKDAEIAALQDRIAELEAMPLAVHNLGDEGADGGKDPEPLWMQDPINQKGNRVK